MQADRPDDHSYEHAYYDGTKLLENFVFGIDIPTIAAINGPSAAHTELALLCDITLADETATIVDPHFLVGVVPGDGQQLTLHARGYRRPGMRGASRQPARREAASPMTGR